METNTEYTVTSNRTIQVGNLSQLDKLSYDDVVLLSKMLPEYSDILTQLLYVFHSESDLVRFLDLFAGTTFKLPPRTKIYHAIRKINIYKYYQSIYNQNTPKDQLLYLTAKRFQLTKQYITTIVDFMSSIK